MVMTVILTCDNCKTTQGIDVIDMYKQFFSEYIEQHKHHQSSVLMSIVNNQNKDFIRSFTHQVMDKKELRDKELVGVEIGVLDGENALSMLENLNIEKLYLIDPYCEYDGYRSSLVKKALINARKLLYPYNDKVEFIKDLSENVVDKIPDNLDFVYIDGNHSYEYVKKDIELYFPKVRDGGIIGGDDFGLHEPGVCEAVSEFIRKNNIDNVPRRCKSLFEDWWIHK